MNRLLKTHKVGLLALLLGVCFTAGLVWGCQRTNGTSGSKQADGSGDGAPTASKQNSNQDGNQKQGGASGTMTEPALTTNGSPDGPAAAASDDGAAAAVAHQPTAMPGAPQPTVKEKEQPKTPSRPNP